jgi:integrase
MAAPERPWISPSRPYVERHPIGTAAYLMLCLMLLLGARRQDAIRLGPKNKRDGVRRYVPKKTACKRVDESVKPPILAPLAEAIRRTERTGLTTFLVTERGQPFTEAGIGNKMRDWCDQAELPECTAHGLEKSRPPLSLSLVPPTVR